MLMNESRANILNQNNFSNSSLIQRLLPFDGILLLQRDGTVALLIQYPS